MTKVDQRIDQVITDLANLNARCCEQHDISKSPQLLSLKLEKSGSLYSQGLESRVDSVQQTIKVMQSQLQNKCDEVTNIVNEIKIRIHSLEEQKSLCEKQGLSLKTQFIIGTIVCILTTLITSLILNYIPISSNNEDDGQTKIVPSIQILNNNLQQ